MSSYKFARRNFFAWTGAAIGLHTLLRNTEAAAQGTVSPKRLLLTHTPVGTIRPLWLCTGAGTAFTFSPILKPFEDAGLKNDIIIIDGLNMDVIPGPGGGHEKGSVVMATASPTKWTRTGQTETDDPMAAGPSVDQLMISKLPTLSDRPFKSLQALCDDRIDHQEISCRCLTYDLLTQPKPGIPGNGGVDNAAYENIPIRPYLKPLDLYNRVFGTMMPGGVNEAALARARAAKKSVLDFSLRELDRLRTLAPASQSRVIDGHAEAIRNLEKELDSQTTPMACGLAKAPDPVSAVPDDGKDHAETVNVSASDEALHQQIGEFHMAVIRAAFACDLTRVATFQWSPGTNHIAFKGLHPANLNGIYTHHPVSHQVGDAEILEPDATKRSANVQYLANVGNWYNKRMSELVNLMKTTKDIYGNPLLDNTVIPFFSEVSRATHARDNLPVCIFGGKNLGFKGGQFLKFPNRPFTDAWLTILEAFDLPASMLTGATILNSPRQGALAGVRG
jgi:Protein of unknown function (DUF1552)